MASSLQSLDNRGWQEKSYSLKDDLIEDANYSRYESGSHWYDKKHSGLLLVWEKLIDKYQVNLSSVDRVHLWIDDCNLVHNEKLYCLKQYLYAVYLHHAEAFSITKTGLDFSDGSYTKTPHGKCFSKEFVSWFNEFSADMLSEVDSELRIVRWCHG